jgi:1,4-dihydroxy-2-naphthoate octaprenyltransferase
MAAPPTIGLAQAALVNPGAQADIAIVAMSMGSFILIIALVLLSAAMHDRDADTRSGPFRM